VSYIEEKQQKNYIFYLLDKHLCTFIFLFAHKGVTTHSENTNKHKSRHGV